MEFIEAHGLGISDIYSAYKKRATNDKILLPSQELLQKRPDDPRAWHCKTVEEYRLWKFSSDYSEYDVNDWTNGIANYQNAG